MPRTLYLKGNPLRNRIEVMVVRGCDTPFLEEHDTVLAALARGMAAYHLIELPTGLVPVLICKACLVHLILAIGNFPARGVVKELLYSLDADFLFVD